MKDIPSDLTLPQLILQFLEQHQFFRLYPQYHPEDVKRILNLESASPSEEMSEICHYEELYLYTDGASRGNPGPAGAGYLIKDIRGHTVNQGYQFLGVTTNNVAEYRALLLGLEKVEEYQPSRIHIFLDSELVVQQVAGIYKVRDEKLKPLYERVIQKLENYSFWEIQHISRQENTVADNLANFAIDQKRGKR